MITTLTKVKDRLAIAPADTSQDALVTQFIVGVGALFDAETDRRLERTVDFTEEFPGERVHVPLRCYPIETITKFEYRIGHITDWIEIAMDNHLVRKDCVLSLLHPLGDASRTIRITYTGGYVFPPSVPAAGQHGLPAALEAAAVEQVALWHQLKDSAGVVQVEKSTGMYLMLGDEVWVPWVRRVVNRYRRFVLL